MSKSNPVPTYNFPKGIPNPDTLQKVGLSRVFTAIQFVILIVYPFIVIMGQGIDDVKHPLLTIPMNLGLVVPSDSLSTPNPQTGLIDGSMAGKSFVSLSASTVDTTELPD